MSLQQLLLILRARARTVLAALLMAVAVALAASLLLPKRYTASASVVVDVRSPDPVAATAPAAGPMPSYMPTQLDIVASDRVAARVVQLLKLDQDPGMRQQWQETTEGRGALEVWLAQGLQKKLKVKPGKDSDVINIAFDSPDPVFAATVANAFARAYIDINVELRTAPARQSAAWFQGQGKVLREALEQAQSRISLYQQDHGIVATDEKLDSETARLSDLSAQLTVVQGQTADARSRAQSSQSIESMPEVMQSTLITGLKGDIARQEAKLQEASKNLGPNHPQFQRMSAEIESLKARLASEIQKIAGSFATASAVGRQKESQLQGAIEVQKRRLLEMKRQRDELGVLMREGETAQKAYDEISRKLTQTSLEGQATQTNVAVLNPAVESLRPSFPNLPLNLLAALLAGMFLGVIAAFVQEIRDRRVRSLADLELILDLPVLAEVRRPSRFLTVQRPALAAT